MAEREPGRSPVRDLETFLVALRELLGEDAPLDAAGSASPAPAARPAVRPVPASAPSIPAPVVAPAAASQTSLLGASLPVMPAAPGLRPAAGAARDPRAVDFLPGEEILRGRCDPAVRAERLAAVEAEVRACTRCVLHGGRNRTVFGVGHPCARLCFVGEGPGAEEDRRGEPFVGRAGQLLDRIVGAMHLRREDVYICNTVKCRPPENRTPAPEEMLACAPYLRTQLEIVAPQVLVALGRPAAQALLGVNASLGELRGRFHRHRGIPVMVTYHPAYLLRNPDAKRFTWEDMQQVMRYLEGHPDPLRA